jgi:hypothetical protein
VPFKLRAAGPPHVEDKARADADLGADWRTEELKDPRMHRERQGKRQLRMTIDVARLAAAN